MDFSTFRRVCTLASTSTTTTTSDNNNSNNSNTTSSKMVDRFKQFISNLTPTSAEIFTNKLESESELEPESDEDSTTDSHSFCHSHSHTHRHNLPIYEKVFSIYEDDEERNRVVQQLLKKKQLFKESVFEEMCSQLDLSGTRFK